MKIAPTNSSKFIFPIIHLSDYWANIESLKKMFSNKCYTTSQNNTTSQKKMFLINNADLFVISTNGEITQREQLM